MTNFEHKNEGILNQIKLRQFVSGRKFALQAFQAERAREHFFWVFLCKRVLKRQAFSSFIGMCILKNNLAVSMLVCILTVFVFAVFVFGPSKQ